MRVRFRILLALASLAPLVAIYALKTRAEDTYTIACVGLPFTKRSLIIELLPDAIAARKVTALRSKGLTLNHLPASHPGVPRLRQSLYQSGGYFSGYRFEWLYVTGAFAIPALIASIFWLVDMLLPRREQLSMSG